MTLPEIKNRWPVAYRAWQLTGEGNDRRQVGVLMGLSRHTVSSHVGRIRKALAAVSRAANADLAPAHVTRCKCGLIRPCHRCVPAIWEMATSRFGESSAGTF